MLAKNYLLPLLLLVLFALKLEGQYTIDLSRSSGEDLSIEATDPLKIKIINLLPGKKYHLVVKREQKEIPPFDLPKREVSEGEATKLTENADCADVKTIIKKIYELKNEIDLPLQLAALRAATGNDAVCKEMVDTIISFTQKTISLPKVKNGEKISIVISRKDANNEEIKWTYNYETPDRGEWLTSYGFSFIAESLSKEKIFFIKQQDTLLKITEGEDRKWLEFAPMVMFTWFPRKTYWNGNLSIGLTGGLGFDFESPVVVLGPSFSYNKNITLTFGLTFHKQKQLNRIYTNDQIIKELITDDQLHEKLYRVNPSVTFSFRFNENPFKLAKSN